MKYYIIAGEASGDLHGSNLIKELKKVDENATIRAWGGELMENEGAQLAKHYKDLAFMGFVEVLFNIRTISKNFKFCTEDIQAFKPDLVIFIDYPGFNLRMAKKLKKLGYKTAYYISPQLWAWKKGRVKIVKRFIDKMFVILPFEKDFYKKHNYEVEYVGHPLLDAVKNETASSYDGSQVEEIRKNDKREIIALLPGSRKQELQKMLPLMSKVSVHFPDYQFVVAGVGWQSEQFYQKLTQNSDVKIVYNETYSLLKNSHAALVTSGTATLETALFRVPQVVCYKGNPISYLIARSLVKGIKYISLVNLIADKELVTELIQGDYNMEKVSKNLSKIISKGEKRDNVLREYDKLIELLGDGGASATVANKIYSMAKE